MSSYPTTVCDQCGAELRGGPTQQNRWCRITINDHVSGEVRQLDLCPTCLGHATVPMLFGRAAELTA